MKRFLKGSAFAGFAALLLFAASACDITSLNDNPNETDEVSTPNLLANAETYLATTYWRDYAGAFWVRYAQYWTTNQYTDADRWQFPSRRASSNNNNWNRFYLGLNDLQEIVRASRNTPDAVAAEGPPANQIAMAQTLQAFSYQMMVDVWGPIPYSEALQGRDSSNFMPAYDTEPEIYAGLLETLTEASDAIQTDQPTLTGSDLIYGGNMDQWKRLANSLKMRIAMRAADVNGFTWGDGNTVEDAIQQALDAGVLQSGDDATIPFEAAQPYQNPFYESYEVSGRNDWAIPESFLGVMNATDDPRRTSYFTATSDGDFVGFPYGLEGPDAQALFSSAQEFSLPGTRVRSVPTAPAFVMLYDEVLFIEAEAAERGFVDADAEGLYEQAIQASHDYWGVDAPDDYVESEVPYDNSNGWAPDDADGNETWKQTLGIQKWIALYLQGIQGWAEWRRLDFQEILQEPPENPSTFGCAFPLRMEYPNVEASVNGDNLTDAIAELAGEDDQGSPLWWDVETPSCD